MHIGAADWQYFVVEARGGLVTTIALREGLLADGKRVSRADLAASQALLARVSMSQGAFDRAAELLRKAIDHFEAVLDRDHDANLAVPQEMIERFLEVYFGPAPQAVAVAS